MAHGVFKERKNSSSGEANGHKKHSAKREHRVGVPLSKHEQQEAWVPSSALHQFKHTY